MADRFSIRVALAVIKEGDCYQLLNRRENLIVDGLPSARHDFSANWDLLRKLLLAADWEHWPIIRRLLKDVEFSLTGEMIHADRNELSGHITFHARGTASVPGSCTVRGSRPRETVTPESRPSGSASSGVGQ